MWHTVALYFDHTYEAAMSGSAQENPYQRQVPLITLREESKWVDCFGEWISRKAIDWCRMWTSNRITPVITRHELQDGKAEGWVQSGFVLRVLPGSSALLTCWGGGENRPQWGSVIHFSAILKQYHISSLYKHSVSHCSANIDKVASFRRKRMKLFVRRRMEWFYTLPCSVMDDEMLA